MSASRTLPAAASTTLPPLTVGLMLFLCAMWGVNMVAVKMGNQGIAPVLQAGLRSLVSALLLALWCRWRGGGLEGWRRPEWLWPGIITGIGFGLEFVLVYPGVELTTASRAVLYLYTAPFFVAIGAHWLLPDDRLTLTKSAGLMVAFAGLVVAFGDGFSAPAGPQALLGDALLLLAGIAWAATTLLVKGTTLRSAPAELVLQYQLVVSAPMLLIASPLMGEAWALQLTPLVVGAFLYQAAGIAFASYLSWFWLISRHSASRLSAFSFLTPVFGVLAGALLLGEPLRPVFLAAVALVALGIWLVNRPDR